MEKEITPHRAVSYTHLDVYKRQVLDCVSHTRVKTPTAAAEYLINHLHDTAKVLEDYASAVLHTISTRMERENTRLNRMVAVSYTHL